MSDLIGRVTWLLIFIRNQCMPATIEGTPDGVDYAIVWLCVLAVVIGSVWFVWGLTGRDSAATTALKTQVLED
jgi:hypothetical protein